MAASLTAWFLVSVAVTALSASSALGVPEHMKTEVVIIGAGFAGITAAKKLIESGVSDIIILEATDRIGGRAREHTFSDLQIELGANWVEGTLNPETNVSNPIWDLAQQIGLRTADSDFDHLAEHTFDENGKVSPDVAGPIWDEADAVFDFSDEIGAAYSKNGREDISLLTAQRIGRYRPGTPLQMATDYFNHDWEFAEPPRVTSLKATHPLPTTAVYGDGFQLIVDPRGTSALVRFLAESVLQHDAPLGSPLGSPARNVTDARLKLNKVVKKVAYSVKGVTITTEDGSVYHAKHAILTVSVGVLQSNLIDFEPDLPAWKIEALYQFNMAVYTKIFLKFPYSFWPNSSKATEYFLYADSKRGYYPVWQHLENEYPGSSVMFTTVTDDESRRIEQQSDNETLAEVMAVLRTMFGPGIPDATEILVSRWWTNPYFRGSFSNWPIGVDSKDFTKMQLPLGRLYFSGEHTSEHFNGYMQGGHDSGLRAAEEVLTCKNAKKCSKHIARLPKVTPAPGDGGDCEAICTQSVNKAISTEVYYCKRKLARAVANATRHCGKP